MRLALLRKHYRKRKGVWVPKIAYESLEEVRERLGRLPKPEQIYTCDICGKLHTSRPIRKQD